MRSLLRASSLENVRGRRRVADRSQAVGLAKAGRPLSSGGGQAHSPNFLGNPRLNCWAAGNDSFLILQGHALVSLLFTEPVWKRTNVRAERENLGVLNLERFKNVFLPFLARFCEFKFHAPQNLLRIKGLEKLRTRCAPLPGNSNRLVLALSCR